MRIYSIIIFFLCSLPISLLAQADVKAFGARGDGQNADTKPIQEAIDKIYADGGGTVNIPAGIFLVAGLILKDNVNLHLQPGAVLLGDPDYRHYTIVNQ